MSVPSAAKRNWFDRYMEGLKSLAEEAPDDYTTTDEIPLVGGLLPEQLRGLPVAPSPMQSLKPMGTESALMGIADAATLKPLIQGPLLAGFGADMRLLEQLPNLPTDTRPTRTIPFSDKPQIPFEGSDFDPANYADYAWRNMEGSLLGSIGAGMLHPMSWLGGPAKGIGGGLEAFAAAEGANIPRLARAGTLIRKGDEAYDAALHAGAGTLKRGAGEAGRQINRIPVVGRATEFLSRPSVLALEGDYGQQIGGAMARANTALKGRGSSLEQELKTGSTIPRILPKDKVAAWKIIQASKARINTELNALAPEHQPHALRLLGDLIDMDNAVQTQMTIERGMLSERWEQVRNTFTNATDLADAQAEMDEKIADLFDRQANAQHRNNLGMLQAIDAIKRMPIGTPMDPARAALVKQATQKAVLEAAEASKEARRYAAELRGKPIYDPATGTLTRKQPIWKEDRWYENRDAIKGEDPAYRDARARAMKAVDDAVNVLGEDVDHPTMRQARQVFDDHRSLLEDFNGNPLAAINAAGVPPEVIATISREVVNPRQFMTRAMDEVTANRDMVRRRAETAIRADLVKKGASKADIDRAMPSILKEARIALAHPTFHQPKPGLAGRLGQKEFTPLGEQLSRIAKRYDQHGDLFNPDDTVQIWGGRMQEMFRAEELGVKPMRRGIVVPGIGMTAVDQLHRIPGLGGVGKQLDQEWMQEAIGKLNDHFQEQGMTPQAAGAEAARLAKDPAELLRHPAMRSLLKDDLKTAAGLTIGTWKEQNLLAPAYHVANLASQVLMGADAPSFGGTAVDPKFLMKLLKKNTGTLLREGRVDHSIDPALAREFVSVLGDKVPPEWLGNIGEQTSVPGAETMSATARIPIGVRLALFGGGGAYAGEKTGELAGLDEEDRAKLAGVGGLLGGLYGWKVPAFAKGNFLVAGTMENAARKAAGITAAEEALGAISRDAATGAVTGTGFRKGYYDAMRDLMDVNDIQSFGQRVEGPVPLGERPATPGGPGPAPGPTQPPVPDPTVPIEMPPGQAPAAPGQAPAAPPLIEDSFMPTVKARPPLPTEPRPVAATHQGEVIYPTPGVQKRRWTLFNGQPVDDGAGWKIHLSVDEKNYDKVIAYLRRVTGYSGHIPPEYAGDLPRVVPELTDRSKSIQWKHLSGGSHEDGKDFTIYVGHRDDAEDLAAKINKDIGDRLTDPSTLPEYEEGFRPSVQNDDIQVGKTSMRFENTYDLKNLPVEFDQYGARGIPYIRDDRHAFLMNRIAAKNGGGYAFDYKAMRDRAHDYLDAYYGDFYTGTRGSPIDDLGTGARKAAPATASTGAAPSAGPQTYEAAQAAMDAFDDQMAAKYGADAVQNWNDYTPEEMAEAERLMQVRDALAAPAGADLLQPIPDSMSIEDRARQIVGPDQAETIDMTLANRVKALDEAAPVTGLPDIPADTPLAPMPEGPLHGPQFGGPEGVIREPTDPYVLMQEVMRMPLTDAQKETITADIARAWRMRMLDNIHDFFLNPGMSQASMTLDMKQAMRGSPHASGPNQLQLAGRDFSRIVASLRTAFGVPKAGTPAFDAWREGRIAAERAFNTADIQGTIALNRARADAGLTHTIKMVGEEGPLDRALAALQQDATPEPVAPARVDPVGPSVVDDQRPWAWQVPRQQFIDRPSQTPMQFIEGATYLQEDAQMRMLNTTRNRAYERIPESLRRLANNPDYPISKPPSKANQKLIDAYRTAQNDIFAYEGQMNVKHQTQLHRQQVMAALEDGQPVPPEVMADYPDLMGMAQARQPLATLGQASGGNWSSPVDPVAARVERQRLTPQQLLERNKERQLVNERNKETVLTSPDSPERTAILEQLQAERIEINNERTAIIRGDQRATPTAEPVAPEPAPAPARDLMAMIEATDHPDHIKQMLRYHVGKAEEWGIVDSIEQKFADGLGAQAIANRIYGEAGGARVTGLRPKEMLAYVSSVRSVLGIPSKTQSAEMDAWREAYRARQAAATALDEGGPLMPEPAPAPVDAVPVDARRAELLAERDSLFGALPDDIQQAITNGTLMRRMKPTESLAHKRWSSANKSLADYDQQVAVKERALLGGPLDAATIERRLEALQQQLDARQASMVYSNENIDRVVELKQQKFYLEQALKERRAADAALDAGGPLIPEPVQPPIEPEPLPDGMPLDAEDYPDATPPIEEPPIEALPPGGGGQPPRPPEGPPGSPPAELPMDPWLDPSLFEIPYGEQLDDLFEIAVERARLRKAANPASRERLAALAVDADRLQASMQYENKLVPDWVDNAEFEAQLGGALEGGLNGQKRNYEQIKQEAIDFVASRFKPYEADLFSPNANPQQIVNLLRDQIPFTTRGEFINDIETFARDKLRLDLEIPDTFRERLKTLEAVQANVNRKLNWLPDTPVDGRPEMVDLLSMTPTQVEDWTKFLPTDDKTLIDSTRVIYEQTDDALYVMLRRAVEDAQAKAGGVGLGGGGLGGGGNLPPFPPAPGAWTWDAPSPNFKIGELRTSRAVNRSRGLALGDIGNAPAPMELGDYYRLGQQGPRIKLGSRGDIDAIQRHFAENQGRLTPNEVYTMATSYGATPQQAARLRAGWDDFAWKAREAGRENANNIHIDYQDISNLIYYGKMGPFPFLTWQAKAIPKYLQMLAHHPGLIVALNEYHKASDRDIEEAGLPESFRNFTQQGGMIDALAGGAFGREGNVYANPLPVVYPYSDVGKEQGDYASPTDKVLGAMNSVGLGPSPLITMPLYMAGWTSDMPINTLRTSPMLAGISQLMTGHAIDPELALKQATRAVRERVAPGETQPTVTGDPIRDYYIRKRIASVAVERTGKPPAGEYLKAIQEGSGPIWANAQRDIEREMTGRTAISALAPIRTRLVDTGEQQIRQAQVESGITNAALEALDQQPLTRKDMQYAAASLARDPLDREETLEERAKGLRVARRFGEARASAPETGGLSGLGADPRSQARRAQLLERESRRVKPLSASARASRERAELLRGEQILRQMGA